MEIKKATKYEVIIRDIDGEHHNIVLTEDQALELRDTLNDTLLDTNK